MILILIILIIFKDTLNLTLMLYLILPEEPNEEILPSYNDLLLKVKELTEEIKKLKETLWASFFNIVN